MEEKARNETEEAMNRLVKGGCRIQCVNSKNAHCIFRCVEGGKNISHHFLQIL